MNTQRWRVGDCVVTSVVEHQTPPFAPQMLFPRGTAAEVARHGWLVPDYADRDGQLLLRIQAFVLEIAGRTLLVDPCVGNGKRRTLPFWNNMTFPFLERFAEAGFAPDAIDTVVHTHLHADHLGWDTHLDGGAWVPTFVRARHLYTRRELEWFRANPTRGEDVYGDSVAPIFDAGLADVVDEDLDLGDGLRFEATPGHTPGHVSMWIESRGETALITGDFMHHPVQCAEPHWAEIADSDSKLARTTRRSMLARVAASGALVLGTHFASRPAGRVQVDGTAFRFVAQDCH